MDIVIIGSGNVAAVLGRKFKAAGHTILQIYSRNAAAASELAYEWDTESTNYKITINKNADIYIIAVSDDAIDDVTADLKLPGKIVVHTAASVPKEVLKNVTTHYGVFYPLQSLRKEMKSLPDTPIFYDGSDELTKRKLESLAKSILREKVTEAGDEARLKLHIAAVVVSNFTNHLYALAEAFCRKEGLDFKQLLPLIEETALRIKDVSPHEAQTGPAARHDKETIQKHLELLKDHPQLKNIYLLLSESIQQEK
ncbi:MAG TPA: F420-dependent NADP oxidoreductase [Chitinophagaceae bacterium]|nr:F420-dependent NADP oxidoreductase [Chitinophagaceae bacterium]HQX73695.1 F420-dependent NADP oxidoreductase [Chitinophagaceae bacterium]HQZ75044.1 F420-dependent NADP oxidoreductase [Chitinophagaceae bacterium]